MHLNGHGDFRCILALVPNLQSETNTSQNNEGNKT